LSEHAIGHPADGMKLSADLIGVLAANKTVYSKTAFILNYDEGGQFFDHHWIPTPPVNDTDGKSNVRLQEKSLLKHIILSLLATQSDLASEFL